MTAGFPFIVARLTSVPERGLLRANSAAGNSGGKPSEHAMTEAKKSTSVSVSSLAPLIYSADFLLERATIQEMRIPRPNPETSWIYAMGVVICPAPK
jgi:hypothetical protein